MKKIYYLIAFLFIGLTLRAQTTIHLFNKVNGQVIANYTNGQFLYALNYAEANTDWDSSASTLWTNAFFAIHPETNDPFLICEGHLLENDSFIVRGIIPLIDTEGHYDYDGIYMFSFFKCAPKKVCCKACDNNWYLQSCFCSEATGGRIMHTFPDGTQEPLIDCPNNPQDVIGGCMKVYGDSYWTTLHTALSELEPIGE